MLKQGVGRRKETVESEAGKRLAKAYQRKEFHGQVWVVFLKEMQCQLDCGCAALGEKKKTQRNTRAKKEGKYRPHFVQSGLAFLFAVCRFFFVSQLWRSQRHFTLLNVGSSSDRPRRIERMLRKQIGRQWRSFPWSWVASQRHFFLSQQNSRKVIIFSAGCQRKRDRTKDGRWGGREIGFDALYSTLLQATGNFALFGYP